MSQAMPSAPTHLARCTHGSIQWGALLGLAKVGVVRVAAPQLLAGFKGRELHGKGNRVTGLTSSPTLT